MKIPFLTTLILAPVVLAGSVYAQTKRPQSHNSSKPTAARSAEIGQSGMVVDETLSVLRKSPSLFSESVHRMQRGRKVQILGVSEADGVRFYKVTAPPANYGWVQADAVFGKFRASDEERLARLAQASDGFDQIEIANEFFKLYPNSKFRPAILLLYGDLLEEVSSKLSKDASSRLSRKEMAASAAPLHSYYLNFNMLDRYRKLGVIFLFEPVTRQYHYDGASWREIAIKFAASPEAAEAKKRFESLQTKMGKR
jgi:hypothetical protein